MKCECKWTEKIKCVRGDACRDTPDPSTGSKNYVIDAPGRYHLKSGKIVQFA